MNKKLYKSRTDRKICGVCGGIANYLNMDSTIVRLVTALLVLGMGSGLLIYFVAALIMDDEPGYYQNYMSDEFRDYVKDKELNK